MKEDIILDKFPKSSGVYIFSANEEVIYIGSSKKLYQRMAQHISSIRKGGNNGHQQDLYQFLQTNHFTVEFQLTDNYKQLEQELIEQYHPKYNNRRANGWDIERQKEHNKEYQKTEKYKKYKKEYDKSDKRKAYQKQYQNQLCFYNGQTITLCALSKRFKRQGIPNPTAEAKKYLIKKESETPIEFYDVYP